MAMEMKRQGDILLVKVSKLPKGEGRAEAPVNGTYVLALGEVTGHSHRIAAVADHPLPELKWFGQSRYLIADAPFQEIHQEHAAQVFEAGVYEVVRQFEIDPERQQRMVAD